MKQSAFHLIYHPGVKRLTLRTLILEEDILRGQGAFDQKIIWSGKVSRLAMCLFDEQKHSNIEEDRQVFA